MKKAATFLTFLVTVSAISFSFINKPSPDTSNMESKAVSSATMVRSENVHNHATEVNTISSNLYESLKLDEKGLSRTTLDVALQGYLTLQEQGTLRNDSLLTVIDFSQSSRKKRFYLLDIKNNKLLENTYVAHAKNSGVDMAKSFSNVVGSEKSSLGFYLTKGTYTGKHGLSLKLAGLEEGYNDNAEARAVVVHGADYVNAGRVRSAYMGRSQGCPAVPMQKYVQIINQIKNGSALFIYYPDTKYLNQSEILNS